MSLYVTGTVNMTNASNAVVGVGTAFLTNVVAGDGFLITGETVYYTVLSVTDDTHLTLSVVYAGATGNGKAYQISRDWTANLGLAEIQPGDPNWPYLLTQKALRKIDTDVAPKASPVFTTQITTSKIVTASGSLVILPVAGAEVTIGDGTATDSRFLALDGGTDSGRGAGVVFRRGGVDKFYYGTESWILGNTSSTPCFFTVAGLGYKWMVNNSTTVAMELSSGGNLGIGMTPTVQFELSGSVGQKATGTTWSNPSDERLKTILGPADLQRCYDDVKALPLLRYTLKDDCFDGKQAPDRTLTGFTANDVQKVIPKAVDVVPFAKVAIPDGEEEYQEQEFILEQVEVEEVEIIAGKPKLVKKVKEQKKLIVDETQVEDEVGNKVVFNDKDGVTKPLMHSIPRMITKTRPKEKKEVIEDCLNLDMSQVYMQMFGALQLLIQKVEALEAKG